MVYLALNLKAPNKARRILETHHLVTGDTCTVQNGVQVQVMSSFEKCQDAG